MEDWEIEEGRGRRKLTPKKGKVKKDGESYIRAFEISDVTNNSKYLGAYKWSEKPDFSDKRVVFMGLTESEYLKEKAEEERRNKFNFKNK